MVRSSSRGKEGVYQDDRKVKVWKKQAQLGKVSLSCENLKEHQIASNPHIQNIKVVGQQK